MEPYHIVWREAIESLRGFGALFEVGAKHSNSLFIQSTNAVIY